MNDKPNDHFNMLTPAELERLALLAEEASEVAEMCMKVIRHGYLSHNPDGNPVQNNRELLAIEVGHFLNALDQMVTTNTDLDCSADDLSEDDILAARRQKKAEIGRWLHHQVTVK